MLAIDTSDGIIKKLRNCIITGESAMCITGWGTYTHNPVVIELIGSHTRVYSDVVDVVPYSDEWGLKDCELIHDNVWVANAERAILESIKLGRYVGYIYEEIDNLDGDYTKLREKAVEYGMVDELEHFINTL